MLCARNNAYFFSCDIRHMFRQIEINPKERHFQKFLWKQGPNKFVQIYRLKILTYGTTSAYYLSTRMLKQLAIDEEDNFPITANIILQDVYLDDILTECSNLKKLEILKSELEQLSERAILSLHKFCKNAKLSCGEQVIGPLSLKEIEKAKLLLPQSVQRVEFFEDIENLKKGEPVP
ncbi:DUF1758 domain-containing protein [Nephila pilipes]|uniref:DUF1758 domain-containing protein n=1 Tax=Nephila pilipes TaxID=299642 RepID=A0A8X6NZC1_NEPPI|nr:DUF1758 domain-containing protein [Nephila pilipes]